MELSNQKYNVSAFLWLADHGLAEHLEPETHRKVHGIDGRHWRRVLRVRVGSREDPVDHQTSHHRRRILALSFEFWWAEREQLLMLDVAGHTERDNMILISKGMITVASSCRR